MPRYSFASLSSQDFEELVRDLLQAEWNTALEAFKEGRDHGIDLRYSQAEGGTAIIQCKHFAASGVRKLLSHLRISERPKIEKLAPARYVVVTSVGLTPANKDKIISALSPFVRRTADVLGAQDIEGLLSRHPDVERTNFKLWLTSTSVLERVLHNAEICQTEFEIDRIRRKLPLFVQNDAFPRAAELLEQTRIVIISGVPGIGKTTLAEMLLYAHLEQGYQPVVIQAEVAEGKKHFKPSAKQIYYYDDFLGQAFLGDRREYLGRNEDAAIVDFMEMVRRSAHSRFILTTREHILKNAFQISEKIAHSPVLGHRCVLELGDYSFGQKARILYNHLYFSDLPPIYKEEVLKDNFFLEIIKHQHFNPRIIEWLSTYTRLRAVAPEQYQAHISQLLESPDAIRRYAFSNQISNAARQVLLCLYTVGEWAETCDLEPVFSAFRRHCSTKYQQPSVTGEFRKALQELDGAFLSYSAGHVSYLNPSIREFVASVIAGDRQIAEDLIVSAQRFRQIVGLCHLAEARPGCELADFIEGSSSLLSQTLLRLLDGPTMRWEKMQDGSMHGYYIDTGNEGRIGFLVELAEGRKSPDFAAIASMAAEKLIARSNHHAPEFASVIDLFDAISEKTWFLDHGGREMFRAIKDSMIQDLALARANDWLKILEFNGRCADWTEENEISLRAALARYCDDGVDYERRECTTLNEMHEFREYLDELKKNYGLSLCRAIERLDEDIAEHEESLEEPSEGSSYHRDAVTPVQEIMTDTDVAEMFGTLRDGI